MRTIDRLVAAGMDAVKAFDVVFCFLRQDNVEGLERYVRKFERRERSNSV